MSNIENIKVLADVAHQSGNYDQSYGYYSRILEEEIDNGLAWFRKGLAAAHLTTGDKEMISEAKTLIQKSLKIGIDYQERQDAGPRLRSAYESITKKLNDELLGKVKDYQKVGMPSGGSALLHMAGQSLNKILSAGAQAEARFKSLDLLEIMCDLENNESSYEYSIRVIDALKAQSKADGNYLTKGSTSIYGARVDRLQDDMQRRLSNLRGGATSFVGSSNVSPGGVTAASPAAKKSGGGASSIFGIIFWLVVILVIVSKCTK